MKERPISHPDWDIHGMLGDRITHIRDFFNHAVAPFEERLRLIKAGEPPFVDHRNPEDCDGPPFEIEWVEASENERPIGYLCLILASKALEDYVRMFIMRELQIRYRSELIAVLKNAPKTVKGNFLRYLWFLECHHPPFSWSSAPTERKTLEDIVLVRNTFMHHDDIDDGRVEQREDDFKRISHSMFSDLRWMELYGDDAFWDRPQPLSVTRKNLLPALASVNSFCDYLEGCRVN